MTRAWMGLIAVGVVFFLALGPARATMAQNQVDDFYGWRQAFLQEAREAGVSPATLEQALPLMEVDDRVLVLDRRQPEKTISFARYQRNTLTSPRVKKGRRLLTEWANVLDAAFKAYGVPPSVVLALWAMESGYGANTGGFSVIRSLTTLAYDGRRASFFRQELIDALKIIQEEGVAAADLQGSWAGAMGQCQFMPSTYRKFAVDANRDGHRDIWGDDVDVLFSIAHYLSSEGWKAGSSWGREVRLERSLPESSYGLDKAYPLERWSHLGVRTRGKTKLPATSVRASLVRPDGADGLKGGRHFLVYDNFQAIMRWNRSIYFALTVGMLSDQIRDAS